jgi:hypothetical protein
MEQVTAGRADMDFVSKFIGTIYKPKQNVLSILIFWTFKYFMSKYNAVSSYTFNTNPRDNAKP